MVDAVVVLVDVIGIISVAIEVIAILCDVLIECLLLLCVEAGVGPTECILGLAAGICAASAGKIFTVIPSSQPECPQMFDEYDVLRAAAAVMRRLTLSAD